MSNHKIQSDSFPALLIPGLCGVLSPMFLMIATIVGGALRQDYDPIANSISELYETAAPNAHWLMVLFTTYHALVIPLAIGLYRGLPRTPCGWNGPVFLGLAGLFGIPLGAYAQCDPGCFGATTFRGQLHGILVLVTVLLIFAAMFATWFRVRNHLQWRGYARYTIVTALIGIAFGIGMVPFIQGQYAGLLERISVTIIGQWYAVSGLLLVYLARGREFPVRGFGNGE